MEGGELKIHALMQSVLSKEVTFNAPFNRLLRDLTVHLRARYIDVDPSDQESLQSIMKRITDNEQAMGSTDILDLLRENRAANPAYKVSLNLQQLQRRNWLVETMQYHLAASDWPPNDRARLHGLHLSCNSKQKRRRDEEDSTMEGPPRSKVGRRAAYLDVSSSRVPFCTARSDLELMEEEADKG